MCSHEYFHLWNVKRLKPKKLKESDLSQETHTELLWFFEGVTSYYDELALMRSGIISLDEYLGLFAKTLTRYFRSRGRFKQPLADSSFDAWTKFYKQDENAPNAIISYYTKGAMVALALDLILHTQSNITLDDVMRALWQQHGKPLIGVTSDGLESLISELSGLDLTAFFDKSLRSTEEIELESLLKPFAVELKLRAATTVMDKGGKASSDTPPPYIGLRYTKDDIGNAKALVILEDSPAQIAGISAGDTIVAINGIKTTAANIDNQLKSLNINKPTEFHYFRRDELMNSLVTPESPKENVCYFDITDTSNPQFKRWLNIND